MTAQISKVSGGYVVHNGWVNGRRTAIYSTYIKEAAEKELASRLAGNTPVIKLAGRQG